LFSITISLYTFYPYFIFKTTKQKEKLMTSQVTHRIFNTNLQYSCAHLKNLYPTDGFKTI